MYPYKEELPTRSLRIPTASQWLPFVRSCWDRGIGDMVENSAGGLCHSTKSGTWELGGSYCTATWELVPIFRSDLRLFPSAHCHLFHSSTVSSFPTLPSPIFPRVFSHCASFLFETACMDWHSTLQFLLVLKYSAQSNQFKHILYFLYFPLEFSSSG